MPRASTYTLTAALVAANVGAGIMCLSAAGIDRAWRLYADRPGASLNMRARRVAGGGVEWRADLPSGAAHRIEPVESSPLIRVDISGPLEQFAGYHDPCDGWSDGHDAIAERLCAAFAEGDVLLVVNSPGGAAAGLQQGVEKALKSKAAHGRKVTGWINEMAGSAAYWWLSAIADTICLPPAGQAGSIGARGEHVSIAGMLAKEGVVKTYFADPPDKVAWAPEFPLGPVGESRGNRDVKIAADAFRAAVCASPIGTKRGLTPEYLFDLGADMLTGAAAVDAGLADDVASEDDVIAMALAQAERGADKDDETTARVSARGGSMGGHSTKNGHVAPSARAEDEKKEEDKGAEPTGKCSHCGMANEDDAKFCDQCGKSLAAPKMKSEGDDDDDPPPSSKDPKSERAAAHPPPPERMARVSAQDANLATLANVLGAVNATLPAVLGAAYDAADIKRTAAWATGKTSAGGIMGALKTMPERLAAADKAAHDQREQAEKRDAAKRKDLAHRLNSLQLDAWPATAIYTRDDTGNITGYKPRVATWDLEDFDGYVSGFEASRKPRTPYDASRDNAQKGAQEQRQRENVSALPANGEPTEEQIDAASKLDAVKTLANQTGRDIKSVAKTFLKTSAGLAQNGVAS